ncbi:MAG: sigma-E factor negative regulatory protein [Caldimonas sp.]
MSTGSFDESASRERLSALVDGELDGSGSAAACAAWRDNAEVRRDWHAWLLIGDVLRSDDLASDAGRDAGFLAAVRVRLASEPVVLAPMPTAASHRRPSRWMLGSAAAAGFVLVVGTFAVLRPGQVPAPAASSLASADAARRAPATSSFREAALRQPAGADAAVVYDGKVIRDARLDRYLAAHKQFTGTSALGVPSAFLRSATVDSTQR